MKGIWTAAPVLSTLTLATLLSLPLPLAADEIGYWRFDPGAMTVDSGKNGLKLLHAGESKPLEFALPGLYEGARFPTTVPLTQVNNTGAAQLDGKGCFYTRDMPVLKITDALTIEAVIKADETDSNARNIASQFNGVDGERGWVFGLEKGQLRFVGSADGKAFIVQTSYFEPALNKRDDYYVAAVYSAGSVTFYLKNLTENGPIQSTVVEGLPKALFDTGAPFRIGASGMQGYSGCFFAGLLDEVRLSNTALAPKELLISPPDVSLAGAPTN
jgi:hypothetical protein